MQTCVQIYVCQFSKQQQSPMFYRQLSDSLISNSALSLSSPKQAQPNAVGGREPLHVDSLIDRLHNLANHPNP